MTASQLKWRLVPLLEFVLMLTKQGVRACAAQIFPFVVLSFDYV